MISLSESDKLKEFVAPKITDLITFLDHHSKIAICTGENIHDLYNYLDMIGYSTNLNYPVQHYHPFDTSYSTNNGTASIHTVIANICVR